jgi:hypothetical protein
MEKKQGRIFNRMVKIEGEKKKLEQDGQDIQDKRKIYYFPLSLFHPAYPVHPVLILFSLFCLVIVLFFLISKILVIIILRQRLFKS